MDRASWTSVVLAAALVAGCTRTRGAEPVTADTEPPAAASPRAEAIRPRFVPPADGRLTASQVEMYLAVHRHARRESAPAQPATSPEQLVAVAGAAARAAALLGYGSDELLWVSARIAEADAVGVDGPGAELARTIDQATREGRLGVQRAATGQANTSAGAIPDGGRAFNRRLLEPYRAELVALHAAQTPAAPARPPES